MVRADQGERRVGRLRHITAAAPFGKKDCKSFLPRAAIVRAEECRVPQQPLRTIQNVSGQPIGLAGHSVAG